MGLGLLSWGKTDRDVNKGPVIERLRVDNDV